VGSGVFCAVLADGCAPTMNTATEVRCFLCGPCIDVISRIISECSADEYSGVQSVSQRTAAVHSMSCCYKLVAEGRG
jgi:hypothetical protein